MYESHITINGLEDEDFKTICKRLGVRPVIIENDTGSNTRQLMTARFHKTNSQQQATQEMEAIASNFKNVVRRKLEKIIGKTDTIPDHLYLEFHLKYEVKESQLDQFVKTVIKAGGHTSKNVVKQSQFATARNKETYFRLKNDLRNYRKINGIMECVVFDDNPNIDVGWHGCAGCMFKNIPELFEGVAQLVEQPAKRLYVSCP